MTPLLIFLTVVPFGVWIPLAQIAPGIPQPTRTFYVTVGNIAFAVVALLVGGGQLNLGLRAFWLPLGGGIVWTAGGFAAFRASETIGLARASGTWTPLNIIIAFAWGALLFGELDRFSAARFGFLAAALMLILFGILLIVGSQSTDSADAPEAPDPTDSGGSLPSPTGRDQGTGSASSRVRIRAGWLWACTAGLLWGSYFVPAQWANVPGRISNVPLALGIFAAGSLLALSSGEMRSLGLRVTTLQVSAGVLFGIGDLALLGLTQRLGTGVGFTVAQLSLLVNASSGIWIFKTPQPGTRAAKIALCGVLLAGVGGCIIGAMR